MRAVGERGGESVNAWKPASRQRPSLSAASASTLPQNWMSRCSLCSLLRQLAQQRQRIVVAGRDRQHAGAVVEGDREGALELAAQRLDLRREPRLRAPLGPQQLLAERRQRRRLALDPDTSVWPSSISQRLSSPQTWRYDSDSARAAPLIEPLSCTAASSATNG